MDTGAHLIEREIPIEGLLPPRRARLGKRGDSSRIQSLIGPRGMAVREHSEGGIARPVQLHIVNNVMDILRGDLVAVATDGADTVPLGGAPEGFFVGPDARDPDGDARLLEGSRKETRICQVVVLTFIAERFSAPESGEDL